MSVRWNTLSLSIAHGSRVKKLTLRNEVSSWRQASVLHGNMSLGAFLQRREQLLSVVSANCCSVFPYVQKLRGQSRIKCRNFSFCFSKENRHRAHLTLQTEERLAPSTQLQQSPRLFVEAERLPFWARGQLSNQPGWSAIEHDEQAETHPSHVWALVRLFFFFF